jgi:uncharacterized protein YbjT (DUF2867 family)
LPEVKTLFTAFVISLTFFASNASADADTTLALIEQWVQGHYHNAAQAEADLNRDIPDTHRHRLMHQLFAPVDMPNVPGLTIFQQAATDGSMNPRWIVRLGVLQFFVDETTGLVRQRELSFKKADQYKNAHLKADELAELGVNDFEWDAACDFYIDTNAEENLIEGPMPGKRCQIQSPGGDKVLTAEDRIEITPHGYGFLGRFVDATGKVMWGTASDELNQLTRASSLEAYVAEHGNRILIFGASRGTGLEVAKQLVAANIPVTAFVRPSSDISALEALGNVEFVVGDAMVATDVQAAFESHYHHAVLSTIGCRGCDVRPDFEANRNIVDAALAAGVERMILTTTIGAGDSRDAPPWIMRWMLKDVTELKTRAETYLMTSGLDYTILRPGGLKDTEPTHRGILSDDRAAFGIIGRTDLALLTIECLNDPETIGQVFSTVDPDLSWPWDMF